MSIAFLIDLSCAGAGTLIDAAKARGLLRSATALLAIQLARDTRNRFVVVAGRLDRPEAGAFAACCCDDDLALASAKDAHQRLGDAGTAHTAWICHGTDAFKQRFTEQMARLQHTDGSAHDHQR